MSPRRPGCIGPIAGTRPDAAVLIAFLQSGRTLDHASSVLLLAVCVLSGTMISDHGVAFACIVVQCLSGLLEKVFAWRVALDAGLFQVLIQTGVPPGGTGEAEAAADNARLDEPDYSGFDAALAAMLGRSAVVPPRSMASRIYGARKLLLWQVVCLGGQVLGLAGLLVALART